MTAHDDRARDEQSTPAGDCACCETSARLCAGLVRRGMSRCCTDCQHEQPTPARKRCWAAMPGHESDAPGLVARCALPIRHTGRCAPLREQPAPTTRETAARNLTPHLDPRDPRAHTTELPTEREIPADELQSEERACAISPVFRETALRLAPLVGKSYPEVPMQLLDEVFGELIEKGVIR